LKHLSDQLKIFDSKAFRRLSDKTQVIFSMNRDAQIRSRLTHSLEVASIAKKIAMNIRTIHNYTLDPDCLFNVGLLHDYGMCAFGHLGESNLESIFSEKTNLVFEANANNLVVIEKNLPKISTLTIVSTIKYPYLFKSENNKANRKKGIYEPQYNHYFPILEQIINQQNQYPHIDRKRTYECDIMEIADDIAYLTSDLEDAITSYDVSIGADELTNYFKKFNLVNPDLFMQLLNSIQNKNLSLLWNLRDSMIQNIHFDSKTNSFIHRENDLKKLQDVIRIIDKEFYIEKFALLETNPLIVEYKNFLREVIDLTKSNPSFVAENIIISKTYRKKYLDAISNDNLNKAYKILLITIAEWTDTTMFDKIKLLNKTKLNY